MSPENRPGDEYADRLRDVLRAEAEAVVPAADGLARIRERTARRGAVMRWVRPALVVGSAAVVAGAVVLGFALTGNDTDRLHQNPPVPLASDTETPTVSPTPGAAVRPAPPSSTLPVGLPVWPFADGVAAAQAAGSATAEPSVVALRFTTVHLGFTDDNLVLGTTKSADGQQAWVSIGFHTEGPRTSTAAVVHLARWSGNGPWEVVGTRDTTLTLTKPSYGTVGHSPLAVGGKITGVDESIRVAVHQPSTNQPLGIACCKAAGGQATPWSTTVTYGSSNAAVLTVVASTGGHLIEHERWAITAVRTKSQNASLASSSSPSTFVAVSQQRIGVFRTTDGSRVRWLTSPQPGGGASDPQVVGSYVYFLRGVGTCANGLARVPLAGGSEHGVYTPSGATISGYGVSASGRLAMNLDRCSDSMQRLLVLDPSNGQTHATPYSAAPPLIVGNPAWTSDNAHLALFVRGGNFAQVHVVNASTVNRIDTGTVMCGGQARNPAGQITDHGGTLAIAEGDTSHLTLETCAGSKPTKVFTTAVGMTSVDGFAGDGSGNYIVGGPDTNAATGEDLVIWSGGHARTLHLHGVTQPSW